MQATITLSTSYMQIWERQPEIPLPEGVAEGTADTGTMGGGGAAEKSPTKPMDAAADP